MKICGSDREFVQFLKETGATKVMREKLKIHIKATLEHHKNGLMLHI